MKNITKYLLIYKIGKDKNLLLNTLTSALDIVTDDVRNKIEDMQLGKFNINQDNCGDLYTNLKERGYLYDNEESERDIFNKIKMIDQKIKKMNSNKSFTICPTMGCNLRCTYCFESEDLHKEFDIMSEQQLNTIFNYILKVKNKRNQENQDIDKVNPIQIKLFGGEPLLKSNIKIIEKILDFSYKNYIRIAIITNGTTIPYYYNLIKKYKEIISIQITIDGKKEIHDKRRIRADGTGTFDEICENINLILQLGITIQLRINVDKENIDSLHELGKVIKDRGWDQMSNINPYVSPVLDFSGTSDFAITEHELLAYLIKNGYYNSDNSFIKRIVSPCIGYIENFFNEKANIKPWKTSYCEATSGSDLCFSPDGKISTCLTFTGKGKHEVGSFDENGVYLDDKNLSLWTERNIFMLDKCKNCKFAFLCGGGCPAMALERNCNINDCICSDVAATLETYVSYKFRESSV